MKKKDSPEADALVEEIRDAVRKSVAPPYTSDDVPLSLHEPYFRGNENAYVKECIDTGWVSSVGKFVDRFEQELADYTGVKRAVAVSNGTAALHIALLLAGVEAGDEVLVPALTFVATANAVSYLGASPHFVDSEDVSLGMDAEKLDRYLSATVVRKDGYAFNKTTGRRVSVLLPMHTFGHPVDLDVLTAVAEKYHLTLVEDAAESIGSFYKGRHTGNFGRIAALSFNGNKTITTGGGGALLTNDEDLGRHAKHLTTQAKVPHAWEFVHDAIGYNYRMPNINAALGCAQLEGKLAVECGYWANYRYNPQLIEAGKNPFTLDSKEPDFSKFQEFLLGENRYITLKSNFPEAAEALFEKTQKDAETRYNNYKKLAGKA